MDNSFRPEDIEQKAKEAQNTPVFVALFGQPGAGKSSLINAILGEKKAEVGVGNDITTERQDYVWNGLTLCDLPGYGTTKFPAETYFERFDVLSLDVFLCVSSGKLYDNDLKFFTNLVAAGKPCIFVRNKIDSEFEEGKSDEQIRNDIRANFRNLASSTATVVFTSCKTKEGLSELEEAISALLPTLKRERFIRSAKAYSKEFLDQKKSACQSYALAAAAAAAAINAIPVPGVGFAADLAAIGGLFTHIRSDFGLTKTRLDAYQHLVPAIGPIASNIIRYASTEGLLWLLKQFSTRVVVSEFSKYIPILGPIIAGSLSFLTIKMIAYAYIDDCYKLSLEMLERKIYV